MMLEALRRAAEARGITTSFTDAADRRYAVSEATLEAVLEAMGPAPVTAAWPPVVVARIGREVTWAPPEGEPATLVLETGEERPLPAELPGDLPTGWHRVEGRTGATTLVVAPARCHLPAELEGGGRAWGWAAQLYAVRSRASWGIGDLGDLAGLLAATAPLGAGFALLNPLHAALPTEPSPYNPSSRVFRNPLYLRIENVPELAALDPRDRDRVEALAGAGRGLLDKDRIDRPAVYRLKDEALRLAHGAIGRAPPPPTWSGSPPSAPSSTSTARTGGPGRPPTAIPAGPRWERSASSTTRRSPTTPGSSGCSTSSWRPSGRAGGSSGW
jgi:4-alpha-glucanotransferase